MIENTYHDPRHAGRHARSHCHDLVQCHHLVPQSRPHAFSPSPLSRTHPCSMAAGNLMGIFTCPILLWAFADLGDVSFPVLDLILKLSGTGPLSLSLARARAHLFSLALPLSLSLYLSLSSSLSLSLSSPLTLSFSLHREREAVYRLYIGCI